MNTVKEIMNMYARGEIDTTTANALLYENRSGFHLDDGKNKLTPEEIRDKTAGLLNVGIGYPDKVKVDPVKMELDQDPGVNYATCLVGDTVYKVDGKKLVEM